MPPIAVAAMREIKLCRFAFLFLESNAHEHLVLVRWRDYSGGSALQSAPSKNTSHQIAALSTSIHYSLSIQVCLDTESKFLMRTLHCESIEGAWLQ